jgi:hypothetical protein
MALKHVDNFGFWEVNPGPFTSLAANNTIVSSRLRQNTTGINAGALISNNLSAQATYILNGRYNTAAYPGVSTTLNEIYRLQDSGSAQCGLGMLPDGKVRFWRSSGIPLGTGYTFIGAASLLALLADAQQTFYDLEIKVTIGNSGSVECRINGGVEISPTTVDTQATSNSTANSVRLGASITGSHSLDQTWEHIIVMDSTGSDMNDFIGPVDVDLLPPSGDGFYTAWNFTGAATRWQAVLNPEDDDSSYIYAAASGDKNLFTHNALPAGTTGVFASAIWTRARRDDGTTRAFKVLLRNGGGSDSLGTTEHFVGDDYIWFFDAFEVSPFTGVAWTVSEVNNVSYGVQVTT